MSLSRTQINFYDQSILQLPLFEMLVVVIFNRIQRRGLCMPKLVQRRHRQRSIAEYLRWPNSAHRTHVCEALEIVFFFVVFIVEAFAETNVKQTANSKRT